MTRFILTLRAIENGQFGGGLAAAARYLIAPDDVAPSPAHAVSSSVWISAILATLALPDAAAGAQRSDDLLFVVHGFNEAFDSVIALHDQIASGLANHANYTTTIVSFDWPSEGQTYAYLQDLDVAAKTAILLVNYAVKPLLRHQKPECRVKINALGHSMGAFVLRAALGHADDGIFTGSDWMLGQVCLVSGDVEASSFDSGDKDTQSLVTHAYRLTNYFNPYDEVLAISNAKRAGVEPRIGRVGLPPGAPPSTTNVNCGPHFATLAAHGNPIEQASFSHSWYFQDPTFYLDLGQTLKGAVDRSVIAGRAPAAEGGYVMKV